MKFFHHHDWLEVARQLHEKLVHRYSDQHIVQTGEIHTFITERCRTCGKWRQQNLIGDLTNARKEAADEWAVPRD